MPTLMYTLLLNKNNKAQIWPKLKNKLRTIEARLHMLFTEKYNTSRHYMWRFITDLSAVIKHRVSRVLGKSKL